MTRGNGRPIKIPVRRVTPQLPARGQEPQPLLAGPDNCREAIAEAQAEARAEAEAQVVDWKERALRLQADAENARKRAERRAQERIAEERRRLLSRMLAVADNLERALAHATQDDPLREGVQLTLDNLLSQLAQEGVEPIEALGQPFDPYQHEAVSSDGSGGRVVIQVLQSGYTLDGALLRPARVIVGRG